MCNYHQCNNKPLTASMMLSCTFMRFKFTIVTLMLIVSANLFYHVLHNQVSIPFLGISLALMCILNVGMRGAQQRSVRMLRFYWIAQLITLLVVLLGFIASVSFFVYFHVKYPQSAVHHTETTTTVKHDTMTVHADTTDPQQPIKTVQDPRIFHIGVSTGTQATANARPACSLTWQNLPYLIIPGLVFLMLVFIKTRSIVLARQMIQLIELVEEEGTPDVELECCSEEEETPAPQQAQEPVGATYAPQAVYYMPAEYPGQLQPVYVDTH
jgi:hypothetical protein